MGLFDFLKPKKIKTEVSETQIENKEIIIEIGDVILLYWIQTNIDVKFPSYFEYDYKLNPYKHRSMLIDLGLLSYQKSSSSLQKLKVSQLKEMLQKHNMPTSGKKDTLIQRIIENFDELENEIPESLCLTEEGQKVIDENELLIRAHKDKFMDVAKFGTMLHYNPNATYEQLKEAIHREEISTHLKEMNFGLVRNAHHALAEMYEAMELYEKALRHYLEVILLDCSGLGNSYNFVKRPIYEDCYINSYQVTKMRNCAEECDLDDYNKSFDQAMKDIKSFKAKIFLTNEDFKFIRSNLLTEDLIVIETYLKKYEKFNYDYYIK
ncbi:TPA: SAP domain-containing protein [Streptococcus suis]